MKRLTSLILVVLMSSISFAQLSKDDIKEILIIQGNEEGKFLSEKVDDLYERYNNSDSYQTSTLLNAVAYTSVSGFAQGSYESYIRNFKHTEWLPGFMQDWYQKRVSSDDVFAPSLTYHKIWRDVDYVTDRMAYKQFKRYFGGNAYLATAAQFVLKKIDSYMIKNKMRTGRFF